MQDLRIFSRLFQSARHLALFALLILLFLAIGTGGFLLLRGDGGTKLQPSQADNLDDDTTGSLGAAGQRLEVNAQLQINGQFYLAPSELPENAKAGQLVFDQVTNILNYFNGTEFVPLTAPEDVVIPEAGVTSLQGQTGAITLTPGAGITINGTTISSSGILGINGVPGDINVTTANGIASLSLPQSIAPSASPTFNGLTLANALPVSSGGTGGVSFTANGVLIGNGTSAFGVVSTGVPGQCLISTAGAPTFGACAGGGGGVSSLNGLMGNLTLANATGLGSTVTIDDATTASKGIASFNSANFTVVGGAVNTIQNIGTGATPTFNGLSLSGAPLAVSSGGLGATSLTTNAVLVGNGASAPQQVTSGAPGQCLVSTAGAPIFSACPGSSGIATLTLAGTSGVPQTITDGNTITIGAGTNVTTTAGATDTVTIAVVNNPTFSGLLTAQAGVTITAGQTFNFNGDAFTDLTGTGLIISGGALQASLGTSVDLAAEVTGTLPVTNGGTGAATFTAGSILFGNGTGAFTNSGVLANGQLLIGDGSGAPTVATLTQGTGIQITNGAGSITVAIDSTVCTTSGNCAGVGGTGDIINNGQNGPVTVGTNNATSTILETNNVARLTIDSAGAATFSGSLTVTGAATFDGNLTVQVGDTFTMNGDAFTDLTGDGLQVSTGALGVDATVCRTSGNCVGGGGGGAPNAASYVTIGNDATLTNERAITAGTNLSSVDGGANGAFTLNVINNPTFSGLVSANGGLTVEAGDTFTVNGDAFTDLTGTGLTIVGNALQTTLGIDINLAGSEVTGTLAVGNGGTGAATFTQYGVLYGNGTGAIQATAAGSTNQCLLATTGSAPSWGACPGDGVGVTTIGAIDSQTPSANGAVIVGSTLYLQSASATNPGLVSTSNQVFAGEKTFNDNLTVSTAFFTITDTNADSLTIGEFGNGAGTIDFLLSGGDFTQQNLRIFGDDGGNGFSINSFNVFANTTNLTGTLQVGGLATFNGNLTVQVGDTFTMNGDAFTDLTGDGLQVSTNALGVDATVCRTSGNCAGVGGTGDILQNGNSFTATMTIGTNDANTLDFETSGSTRFSVSSTTATLTGVGNTSFLSPTTSSITVDSGTTGTVNLGSGANAKTINLGTGAAVANTINIGGTGANTVAIGNTQTAGSISLGSAMTTGTINIGGTGAQTGTITLGGGTGAQVINLGTGGTSAKTVTLGSIAATSSTTTIQAGSGNINLNTSGGGILCIGNGGFACTNANPGGLNSIGATSSTTAGVGGSSLFLGSGSGASSGAGSAGGALTLQAGNAFGTGNNTGGAVFLGAGSSTGTTAGANVNIGAGNGGSTSGAGGSILLQPGAGNGGSARGVVQVGSSTTDANADLFVFDSYNQASDPTTSLNGATYYNSNTGKLRCYENSAWKDCITSPGGLFTDSGSFAYLTQTTDSIGFGTSTDLGAKLQVVGTSDQEQLLIRANSTQTDPLILAQTSGGSELFRLHAPDTHSVFLGYNAGSATTANLNNVGIGRGVLQSATGDSNVGVGWEALYSNTTGWNNVALGAQALYSNSTGLRNVAIGTGALMASNSSDNIAMGNAALLNSTSASENIALGSDAQRNNTTGSSNIAIGNTALRDNSTGGSNIAIGSNAQTTGVGSYNVGIGQNTLNEILGNENVALGHRVLESAGDAYGNNGVGTLALGGVTTGDYNIALGYQAGDNITTGSQNIIIGHNIDAGSATGSNQLNIAGLLTSSDYTTAGLTVTDDLTVDGSLLWVGPGTGGAAIALSPSATGSSTVDFNNLSGTDHITFDNNTDTFTWKAAGVDQLQVSSAGLLVLTNTTLGNASSDTVTFTGMVNSHILPSVDDTYDLGSSANRWRDLYLGPATLHIGTTTSDEATFSYDNSTDTLVLKNATNSTSAFQIQNSSSAVFLNADTTNSRLEIAGNIYSKGLAWTVRAATAANQWDGVAYGNGLFVAVSSSGTNRVMTSPDGVNWTARTVPVASWRSIVYGDGLFVAVASGGVMTSPDGITWTSRTPSDTLTGWTSVTYGNGLFVAVANSGGAGTSVMTSPDGITWTSRTVPEANAWASVTYGSGLFVAVSNDGTNRVMTSPDGITWTARSAAEANLWNAVTYGNGLFVAVSLSGTNRVMTSPDGITWTARSAVSSSWWGITYGNGLFVAVGSGGVAMTSPDGITWTSRTLPENNWWWGITYGNGMFVSVATSGTNRVMTSGVIENNIAPSSSSYKSGLSVTGGSVFNGTSANWTSRTSAQDNTWRSITYGNSTFVAVASDGTNRVMTSPDGITWTARTAAEANSWRSVTYGSGLFVAVSNDGTNRVMTSPDGITWTARTAAEANTWNTVTYGNGLFVAVSGSGTNRVMTSPDGITWTARTAAATFGTTSISVTYGNGLFVATSSAGTNQVMTSPDGITWTARTAATTNQWQGVTYGNGLFVAVSSTGTGNRVMTSPDGITWTSRTSTADNSWLSVTYGSGLFVAVSNSGSGQRIMTSPDGITWTAQGAAAANGWSSVTYGNGLFAAVSTSGTGDRVMTSTGRVAALTSSGLVVLQDALSVAGQAIFAGTISYVSGTADTNTAVCRNSQGQLAGCTSSQRYKSDVNNLTLGLDELRQLQPVSYTWNTTGQQDIGFIAEQVALVIPQAVTYGANGEVVSFNPSTITALLVSSVQQLDLKVSAFETRLIAVEQGNFAGNITVGGKIVSRGNRPTPVILSNSTTDAITSAHGTDVAGSFIVVTGSATPADMKIKLVFAQPYDSSGTPIVQITPFGLGSSDSGAYVDSVNGNEVVIGFRNSFVNGGTYKFNYMIIHAVATN